MGKGRRSIRMNGFRFYAEEVGKGWREMGIQLSWPQTIKAVGLVWADQSPEFKEKMKARAKEYRGSPEFQLRQQRHRELWDEEKRAEEEGRPSLSSDGWCKQEAGISGTFSGDAWLASSIYAEPEIRRKLEGLRWDPPSPAKEKQS